METSRPHIPDLSRQSLAVNFIETHLDVHYPAFAPPLSQYDPNLRLFMARGPQAHQGGFPPEPYTVHISQAASAPALLADFEDERLAPRPLAKPGKALKFWDSLFEPAMKQFKETHPTAPPELVQRKIGIRDETDWAGVFHQLEKVKQEYGRVDKGFKARFRRVYRKFSENVAPPMLGATGFVPNVDYVSPVLGPVQIFLEAAIQAVKVRQQMLSAFDDIDMKFSQVEFFLEIYKGDKNVENASINLIAAVFRAVECVMSFFVKRIWRKFLSATFQTEQYQQTISASLDEVETQSGNLIDQAKMSSEYEMSCTMRTVLNRTPQWKRSSKRLHHGQQHLRRGQEQIRHDQVQMEHDLRNNFMVLLDECHRNRQDFAEKESILCSTPSLPAPSRCLALDKQHISPQDLLDWIDIPDLADHDMEHIDEKGHVLVLEDEQARAEHLIQAAQFQEWLTSLGSTQLLVHGNYKGRRLMSGLSLFCASFVRALAERAPRFIHLIFFCGLHEDPEVDKYAGALVIIQSFICQLLCQFDFGPTAIPASTAKEVMVRLGDIETLCAVFQALIHRLPRSVVVVCVIDGVVYYERPWLCEDLGVVLVALLKISAEQNTQAAVKILITSPTKTTDVRRPFPDEMTLSMEAMARPGWAGTKLGLERQLGEEFGDQAERREGQDTVAFQGKMCEETPPH